MTATVAKIKDAGAAFAYYSERDDYYLSDKSAAEWHGAGAARLGLVGDIDPNNFRDVLRGQFRDAKVGNPDRHTPGWDMTFSAPKSVSIAALVNKDERLTAAHDAAVRAALDHLERHSIVTRQRNPEGGYEWRNTGSMVAGVVRHSTSRNADPQLHSHAVIANITHDQTTGNWVSIDSRAGLYQSQREAGNLYMNELAAGARKAGYEVQWTVDERGNASFELREISSDQRQLFSSRRVEIEAALAARGIDIDNASGRARETATLDTRQAKEHVPGRELHARWQAQSEAAGFSADQRPEGKKEPPRREQRMVAARAAVGAAMEHLGERQTRFTERQLAQEATLFVQGKASQCDLADAIAESREAGRLLDRSVQIRGHSKELERVAGFTTQAAIDAENDMLRRAERLARTQAALSLPGALSERLIEQREAMSGHAFTAEQREATQKILSGWSRLSIVQGYAGTAKTTTVLATVADAARGENIRVRAIAPTHSAASTLGAAIKAEAATVAATISKPLERDGRREVWIVDEAGLVSANDMRALLTRADQAGAQVVLTGDTKQIGSVGAGSAFQQIQDHHPSSTHSLTDIKRQTSSELRAAVYDALEGRFSDALGKVEARESKDREQAIEAIADRYLDLRRGGKTTLVVTLSRADRADVNAEIQSRLEAAGAVRDVRQIQTLASKGWTEAEQRDAARYRAGDVIEAGRNFRNGPQRGELAVVERVESGRVIARRQDGSEWKFDPSKVTKMQVLDRAETRVGIGDRIVAKGGLTAADATDTTKPVKVANGTGMTVASIDETGRLTARLDTGRTVVIDTRQGLKADLAYAQTADQAQGQTTDAVVAWMRSTQTNLADRQHAYVAMSRARETAVVVTDDRDRLAATLTKSSEGKDAARDTRMASASRQQAPEDRRPLSAKAKEWAADQLAVVQSARAGRAAQARRKAAEKWEAKDRKWLREGERVQQRIRKDSARAEREIARTFRVNPDAGRFVRLFENKSQRRGREIIERVRSGREQALSKVERSMGRAMERRVERLIANGMAASDARKQIAEETYIDRHHRVEAAIVKIRRWFDEGRQAAADPATSTPTTTATRRTPNMESGITHAPVKPPTPAAERQPTQEQPAGTDKISILPDGERTPRAEPEVAPVPKRDRGFDIDF